MEEDIWSPTYGMKGKLDATVQASITSPSPSTFSRNANKTSTPAQISKSHPAPFEIKTGRTIAGTEHRAQTLLYTLLTSERYATPVESGLLYYTQTDEVVRVPVARNEIRGLISGRNLLAGFVARRGKGTFKWGKKEKVVEPEPAVAEAEVEPFLPTTIDDERICGRCYQVDACMLYRKVRSALVHQLTWR